METLGNRLWDSFTAQMRPGASPDSPASPDAQADGGGGVNASTSTSTGKSNEKAGKEGDLFNTLLSKAIDIGQTASEGLGLSSEDVKTGGKNTVRGGRYTGRSRSDVDLSNNGGKEGSGNPPSTYVDMFVERILSMAIPTTTTSSKRELDRILGRIEMQRSRPSLSMQIMSKNSILLLQRLSVPFETLDFAINVINWKNPIKTVTVMIFLSLCILKPINLLTIPLFYVCFEVIIPAYMVQNPNIDESVEGWENELPKPVNQISREFLLNVTDLQNHMLLYVDSWDFIISWCWRLFYFKDELLTWFIFVALLSSGIFMEIFGTSIIVSLLPFVKLLLVAVVCAGFIALHPTNREKLMRRFHSEQLRLQTVTWVNYYESKLLKDLDLNNADLEIRQMEIFELQHFNEETKSWQFVCFSNDIYPPNSHMRLNNLSIEGTLTLDAISPPDGWKFINQNMSQLPGRSSAKDGTGTTDGVDEAVKKQHKRMIFDHEKNKLLKSKKKHEKVLKKRQLKQQKAKIRSVNETGSFDAKEANIKKIKRRRQSNDFNNILLDPLTLKKTIVEQMETGITYEGWYLDMCPDEWVSQSYLGDMVDVDNDTKWVYDFIVMGNGASAYSAGGLGISGSARLKKNRGDVRRRRWVRYAVREIIQSVVHDERENGVDILEGHEENRSDSDIGSIDSDSYSDIDENDDREDSEDENEDAHDDADEANNGGCSDDADSMDIRAMAGI